MFNFLHSIVSAIPNLIAAILLLVIAFLAAKVVKDLTVKLLKAVKAEKFLNKFGVKDTVTNSSIEFVGKLVYFVIFLLFLPSVLNKLGMSSVSGPITGMVDRFIDFIPKMVAAGVIVAAGLFIAKLVAELLQSLLAGIGTDSLVEKITGTPAKKVPLSKGISEVVKYVLIVIFLVEGINVLDLAVLTQIGVAVIGYMPAVISAVLIVAIAVFAANTVENLIAKNFPKAKTAALVAKVAIYVLAVFLCLSQLNVATAIVETTFILIIAALCIAFAVAFGIGGRDFAANRLAELEEKLNKKDSEE